MLLEVDTTTGRFAGRAVGQGGVFRGIRYGAAPVGSLRFRNGRAAKPAAGLQQATAFGAASVQRSSFPPAIQRAAGFSRLAHGEDCLFLNVTTPRIKGPLRPVMVWIHGGGFNQGSSGLFLYSAGGLAARGDVVLVTLNYRLGVLGSWPAGGAGFDANPALSDQLLALEWVRDNIERFGGDPACVTVFGQSAGAMSLAALLASPRAEGLFHRAILQSGAAANVSDDARRAHLSDHLERAFEVDGAAALGDAARGASVARLLDAQSKVAQVARLPLGQLAWQPGVDGDLVPEQPLSRLRAGRGADIPLLIGTNLDEWKMFTATDAKRRRLSTSMLHTYLERTFEAEPDPKALRDQVCEAFGHDSETGRKRSASQIWVAFQTARVFGQPACELAEAHEEGGRPVFMYRFDWKPPLLRDFLGACHSMEIPFVFGSHSHPVLLPAIGLWPQARALSARIQDAWLSFARTGSPKVRDGDDWPGYTRAERATRIFDVRDRVVLAPDESARSFLAGL